MAELQHISSAGYVKDLTRNNLIVKGTKMKMTYTETQSDEFKVVGKAYHEYQSIFYGPCTGVVFYCKNGAAAVILDIDGLENEADVGDVINPEDYDIVGWNLALDDERFWTRSFS